MANNEQTHSGERSLRTELPSTSLGPPTIEHFLSTASVIGFDRSAFVAGPPSQAKFQKLKNRVNVRFITKVFRSILPKS